MIPLHTSFGGFHWFNYPRPSRTSFARVLHFLLLLPLLPALPAPLSVSLSVLRVCGSVRERDATSDDSSRAPGCRVGAPGAVTAARPVATLSSTIRHHVCAKKRCEALGEQTKYSSRDLEVDSPHSHHDSHDHEDGRRANIARE